MTPTPLWRFCLLCRARTRHDGDVCENDPRHPRFELRPALQVEAFPEHADEAALWCRELRP
jgi:hypothetical protein